MSDSKYQKWALFAPTPSHNIIYAISFLAKSISATRDSSSRFMVCSSSIWLSSCEMCLFDFVSSASEISKSPSLYLNKTSCDFVAPASPSLILLSSSVEPPSSLPNSCHAAANNLSFSSFCRSHSSFCLLISSIFIITLALSSSDSVMVSLSQKTIFHKVNIHRTFLQ